jgi:hypothetical protein
VREWPTGLSVGQHLGMTAPSRSAPTKSPTLTAYVAATAILALLVAVQALLAGRSIAGLGQIDIHGYVGNASFVVGIVLLVLALVARLPKRQLWLAAIVLILLFSQTGLGYVGRDSAEAVSWHVFFGVITFAAVVLQHVGAIALSRQARGGSGSSS